MKYVDQGNPDSELGIAPFFVFEFILVHKLFQVKSMFLNWAYWGDDMS